MTNLPTFTDGTAAQIAYANDLRAKVLAMLAIAEAKLSASAREAAKPLVAQAATEIRENGALRYWLDTYAGKPGYPVDPAMEVAKQLATRFVDLAGMPADMPGRDRVIHGTAGTLHLAIVEAQ